MYENDNGTSAYIDARPDVGEPNVRSCTAIAPFPIQCQLPVYNMNHSKRGMALIFNHEFFLNGQGARLGTNEDCLALAQTLQGMHFDVGVYQDLSVNSIFTEIEKAAAIDHCNSDCILLAILSHGGTDGISAADSYYKLDMIIDQFTADRCPTLTGKPKILIVQACRGKRYDTGVQLLQEGEAIAYNVAVAEMNGNVEEDRPAISFSTIVRKCMDFIQYCCKWRSSDNTDSMIENARVNSLPSHSDFIIAYSTPKGFVSYRNEATGGQYIQTLCAVLKEHGKQMNIYDLLTFVSHRVAIESKNQFKQMPTFESSLTATLKFNEKEI